MSYWAGLFLENDKEVLMAGVNTMLAIAVKLMKRKRDHQGELPKDDHETYQD